MIWLLPIPHPLSRQYLSSTGDTQEDCDRDADWRGQNNTTTESLVFYKSFTTLSIQSLSSRWGREGEGKHYNISATFDINAWGPKPVANFVTYFLKLTFSYGRIPYV
jgi:hypothetical protein